MGTRPRACAWLLVKRFMACRPMLKSGVATSMAKTLMDLDTPWALTYVKFQHVPQSGSFQPETAGAPPMRGKLGNEPKVVKPRVWSPLGPFEHATVLSDWVEMSYTGSKLVVRAAIPVARAATTAKNFIVEW